MNKPNVDHSAHKVKPDWENGLRKLPNFGHLIPLPKNRKYPPPNDFPQGGGALSVLDALTRGRHGDNVGYTPRDNLSCVVDGDGGQERGWRTVAKLLPTLDRQQVLHQLTPSGVHIFCFVPGGYTHLLEGRRWVRKISDITGENDGEIISHGFYIVSAPSHFIPNAKELEAGKVEGDYIIIGKKAHPLTEDEILRLTKPDKPVHHPQPNGRAAPSPTLPCESPTQSMVADAYLMRMGFPLKNGGGGQLCGPCPRGGCAQNDGFYVYPSGAYFCRKCCPDGGDKDAFLALKHSLFPPAIQPRSGLAIAPVVNDNHQGNGVAHPVREPSVELPPEPDNEPIEVNAAGAERGSVEVDDKGRPIFERYDGASLKSACQALELAKDFRLNVRSDKIEYQKPDGTWQQLDDYFRCTIHERVEYRCRYREWKKNGDGWEARYKRFRYTQDDYNRAFAVLAGTARVDPFVEWLRSLPQWDRTPRLTVLLADIFDADHNDPLVVWASQYLCLAPIQRALEPGCQLRECPILIGPQAIGKSRLLTWLMPEEGRTDWVSDSWRLSERETKKNLEAVGSAAVVEMPELAGIKGANIERMKAMLSATQDTVRLSFRRDSQVYLRRFCLVGTSNEMKVLPDDPTGNSRMVPVVLYPAKVRVEDFLDADDIRSQLWAEAWHMYHDKANPARANLPFELRTPQARQAEVHRYRDEVTEDAVREALKQFPASEGVKVKDILEAINRRDSGLRVRASAIAKVLEREGWKWKHTKHGNLWFPPVG